VVDRAHLGRRVLVLHHLHRWHDFLPVRHILPASCRGRRVISPACHDSDHVIPPTRTSLTTIHSTRTTSSTPMTSSCAMPTAPSIPPRRCRRPAGGPVSPG